jgi:hypothetical protein
LCSTSSDRVFCPRATLPVCAALAPIESALFDVGRKGEKRTRRDAELSEGTDTPESSSSFGLPDEGLVIDRPRNPEEEVIPWKYASISKFSKYVSNKVFKPSMNTSLRVEMMHTDKEFPVSPCKECLDLHKKSKNSICY